MSLSYAPLKVVSVNDPVIDLLDQQDREYVIIKGGNQYTYKQYNAQTISNTSITFNCPPPSANTIVSRKMYVQIPVRLTFTGSNTHTGATGAAENNLLSPGNDAFRQFPISSSCNMLQLVINGQPVNIPLSDVIHALSLYNCGESVLATEFSISPNMPDQTHDYNDLVGSINNPLSNFFDARQGLAAGRASYAFTVVENTRTRAVVDAVITEPLFVSPAFYGEGDASGFYNTNAISATFNFVSNGFRMWSHVADTANVITNIQMQFNAFATAFSYQNQATPSMLFKYITPSNQMNLSPVNMALTYPYFEVNTYPTDQPNALTFGQAPVTLQSANLQLNSIPRKFYIWIKRQNVQTYASAVYPDVFYPITNINVTLGNYTGQLTSATPQQLYEISLKNGFRGSYTQWTGQDVGGAMSFITPGATGYAGATGYSYMSPGACVLCLDPSTDLGLPDNVCSGYQDQINFQVSVTTYNPLDSVSRAKGMLQPFVTLWVATISEGSFVIPQINSAVKALGIITAQDIISAHVDHNIKYHDVVTINGGNAGSGNFLSNLKNVGMKINDALKSSKLISKVLATPNPYSAYTAPASAFANSLGYGDGGAVFDPSQDMENYGGRRMSKKSLAHRLRRI